MAFGCDGRLPVPDGEPAQATFTLEVNEWNGVCEPRLVLRRARAAEQPAALLAPRRRAPREGQQELALFAVQETPACLDTGAPFPTLWA